MTRLLMSNLHQPKPWDWSLAQREVHTLTASPAPRWLRLEGGCLWLTRRDSHGRPEDDVWLTTGESLLLPAGSAWVLQAWPQARLSLLLQAPAGASQARPAVSRRWWQRPLCWLRFSVLHA